MRETGVRGRDAGDMGSGEGYGRGGGGGQEGLIKCLQGFTSIDKMRVGGGEEEGLH